MQCGPPTTTLTGRWSTSPLESLPASTPLLLQQQAHLPPSLAVAPRQGGPPVVPPPLQAPMRSRWTCLLPRYALLPGPPSGGMSRWWVAHRRKALKSTLAVSVIPFSEYLQASSGPALPDDLM